jgi:hypothetical protein
MRKLFFVGIMVALGVVGGCSSDEDDGAGGATGGTAGSGAASTSGGSGGTEDGGSGGTTETGGSGGTEEGGSGGTTETGGTGGTGGTGETGGSAGTETGGTGGTTETGGTGGSSTDPYAAEREACFQKVNALRATKGLAPYARWTSGESCADDEASQDAASNTPHGAFGQCGEMGQNECPGWGTSAAEACLESMWAEKDQDGCQGCDACADNYTPNCPGCDFYGTATGDTCGHYVNMSAKYLSEVACGFSDQGGWIVINFR